MTQLELAMGLYTIVGTIIALLSLWCTCEYCKKFGMITATTSILTGLLIILGNHEFDYQVCAGHMPIICSTILLLFSTKIAGEKE
jgi:hypothetical protein